LGPIFFCFATIENAKQITVFLTRTGVQTGMKSRVGVLPQVKQFAKQ